MEWLIAAGAALVGAIAGSWISHRLQRENDERQLRAPTYATFIRTMDRVERTARNYYNLLHIIRPDQQAVTAAAWAEIEARWEAANTALHDSHLALVELELFGSIEAEITAKVWRWDMTMDIDSPWRYRGEDAANADAAYTNWTDANEKRREHRKSFMSVAQSDLAHKTIRQRLIRRWKTLRYRLRERRKKRRARREG
jgi:hypothetical protein